MLLSSLISLPLLGASFIFFLEEKNTNIIKFVGLVSSGLTFFISLLLWILFDSGSSD